MTAGRFAIVGPSGAGKDLLMQMAAQSRPELHLARRVITRPSHLGGEDFDGVTEQVFAARKAAGEFALEWCAHGLGYAIPHVQMTAAGPVLFNTSRGMLLQAQELWPELVVILITATPEVLARRLADRGRETAADQANRLARAAFTLPEGLTLRTVVNDTSPKDGLAQLLAALQPES